MEFEVRYLKYQNLQVAYASGGADGPRVLSVPNWITNIEMSGEVPSMTSIGRRLGSFCRLAGFDFPGTGLSDPIPLDTVPGLDFWVDLVGTVQDELGWGRPALYANDAGGLVALAFAARHPERVSKLVLGNATAAFFPEAIPDVRDQMVEWFASTYGTPEYLQLLSPSVADDAGIAGQFPATSRGSSNRTRSTMDSTRA